MVHLALQVTGVLQDILVRLDLEDHKAQKVIEVVKVTRDKPVHQVCRKTVSLLLIAHHNMCIVIAIRSDCHTAALVYNIEVST